MVYSESSETDLLLQTDESNDLDEFTKECNKRVRWDFSNERVKFAQLTAKKSLTFPIKCYNIHGIWRLYSKNVVAN